MILTDIRFNSYEDGDALAASAGTVFRPPIDMCMARVTPKGNIRGGVLFCNWTGVGGSIQLHAAGWDKRWLNRTGLWLAFDYPFNQLAVRKIFAQVRASNEKSFEFVKHLGFREEHVVKDVFPEGDMRLFSMYRDDCWPLRLSPYQPKGLH